MTATTHTPVGGTRRATIGAWGEGSRPIDATAVTALGNITTSNNVGDVLKILDGSVARDRVTTASSTGGASS